MMNKKDINKGMHAMHLKPIGIIRSPFQSAGQAPRQGRFTDETSTLEIFDAYADGLKHVRDRIQTLEGKAADVRQARLDAIRTHCGLDFQHREFALIPKWEAERIDQQLVLLETYDARRLMAKPVFPSEYLRLMQEKASLVAEEKGLERGVLRDISRQIAQELDTLTDYVAAVTRLDDYLARARLSLTFGMTRPQL